MFKSFSKYDFRTYSDKQLQEFLDNWELLIPTRTLYPLKMYIEARRESYVRYNDNSYFYIEFFSAKPRAEYEEFESWMQDQ